MLALFRRAIHRYGDVVSPWLGLAFAGLYLAAVAGVWLVAAHVQRARLAELQIRDTQRWAESIAESLATQDDAGRQRIVRRAGRQDGVSFAAIVAPSGTAAVHSDPAKTGQPVPEVTWNTADAGLTRLGTSQGGAAETVVAARIRSAAGRTSPDSLWIATRPMPVAWTHSELVLWAGYVLLAVLGLYLVLYRYFRRSLQPLDVIRRRLEGCGESIGEQLESLRLNDSYDQLAVSWNRLIEFVGSMQEQLRKSRLVTDVSAAMDGYRSERLTGILMQIPFGVLVVDTDRKISFANRAAVGMLASAGENLDGAAASSVLDEGLCVSLLSASGGSRPGSPAVSRWTDHTFSREHGDSTLRFWSLPGEGGEHILFLQDITQAREAERARDQFLYHVTHELRTPLTNIRAYAETLSEGVIEDTETIRECYNVIMGETQRLSRLVEDILNVSQLEVGTARLDVGEIQIDRLIRTVVQDTQGKADAKNIDLVLNLPAKTPQVRGDKERLAVVLTNLVGNAIKYTPDGGRVEVRCAAESGRVRISVADTGLGIHPDDREKIFEKFYRASDERVAAIPGTGLGLAIVKETVRLHGGAVFVESTLGQGSTFTVTLPASQVDDQDRPAAQSPSVVEKS